jgi:hypothetical protein
MRDKEEGLNLYWGIIKAKAFPFKDCANLHVPLMRTIAETLHSNVVGSIDFNKPCSVSPVGPEDVPKARKAEKLLNWQFTTQVEYFDIVDKIVNAVLVFGHVPVKVRYVIERENGKKTFDGIRIDVLPVERFLMPPDASDSDVQQMDYVMQEIPMTKSDIKKRITAGKFEDVSDEDLDKIGMQSKSDRDADNMLENVRDYYSGTSSDHGTSKNKKYGTVIEWYGNFDHNDDGIEEKVMVSYLKESKKILRAVKQTAKRPLVVIRFSGIMDKATGESLPDLLKHINQELNTLHNQRVDSVTITNIPFFFFDPVAGFNPNEITLSPGVGIPTNGPPSQAVYFPSLNTTRPEMYREEELLFQYAERLLGAGANTQGIMQSKRTTATEVAAVDRRAGIRFLTIFNRIKKGLKGIFQIAFELDKTNMPPEIPLRVTGVDSDQQQFETMSKSDIEGQLDIVINGNSIIDDQAEKQEMMQLYQMGLMNPLIATDPNAMYELTRDTFAKLNAKKIDSYLRKPADTIPKNPEEEHNLFLQEEYVKPNIAENVDEHLKKHAALINSAQFEMFSPKAKALALQHYQATIKMDQIMKQLALMAQIQATNGALMQAQGGNGGQPPAAMAQGQVPGPQVP